MIFLPNRITDMMCLNNFCGKIIISLFAIQRWYLATKKTLLSVSTMSIIILYNQYIYLYTITSFNFPI